MVFILCIKLVGVSSDYVAINSLKWALCPALGFAFTQC